MKKNYFFSKLILCGLFTLATATTFVGCKDYDDDIDNLQSQITANGEAIKKLQELVGAGKFVTAVEATDKGIKVTLNDNTSTEIELAKKGEDAVAPQLQVKDGVWQISLDNGKTFTDMKDATTGDVIKMPEAAEAGTKVEITEAGQIKIGDKVTDFMRTSDFAVIDNTNRVIVFKIGDQTVYVPMVATTVQSLTYVPEYTDKVASAYSLVGYVKDNKIVEEGKELKTFVNYKLAFEYDVNPVTVDLTKATWAFNTTAAKTRAAETSVLDFVNAEIDGNRVKLWAVANDNYDAKMLQDEDRAYMASALMTYKPLVDMAAQEIASEYVEFDATAVNAYDLDYWRNDKTPNVSLNNNNAFDVVYNSAEGVDFSKVLYAVYDEKDIRTYGFVQPTVTIDFAKDAQGIISESSKYYEIKGNNTIVVKDNNIAAVGDVNEVQLTATFTNAEGVVFATRTIVAKAVKETWVDPVETQDMGKFEFYYSTADQDIDDEISEKTIDVDKIFKALNITREEFASRYVRSMCTTKDAEGNVVNNIGMSASKSVTDFGTWIQDGFDGGLYLYVGGGVKVGTYTTEMIIELSNSYKITVTSTVEVKAPFTAADINALKRAGWWFNNNTQIQVVGQYLNAGGDIMDPVVEKDIAEFNLVGALVNAYKTETKFNELPITDYGYFKFTRVDANDNSFAIDNATSEISLNKLTNDKGEQYYNLDAKAVKVEFVFNDANIAADPLLVDESVDVVFITPVNDPVGKTGATIVGSDNTKRTVDLQKFYSLKDKKDFYIYQFAKLAGDTEATAHWSSYLTPADVYNIDNTAVKYEFTGDKANVSKDLFTIENGIMKFKNADLKPNEAYNAEITVTVPNEWGSTSGKITVKVEK